MANLQYKPLQPATASAPGFLILLAKLPVKAAKPDTSAPTRAVIKISNVYEPFSGSMLAIFCESKCSLLTSIIMAKTPHKINNPAKPVINATHAFCGMATATMADVIAKLHHGKYSGMAKPSSAVSSSDIVNFIFAFLAKGFIVLKSSPIRQCWCFRQQRRMQFYICFFACYNAIVLQM